MKFISHFKPVLFLILFFILPEFLSAQLTFQRTFQAADMNGGLSLALTSDGGYVVTGQHGSSGQGLCDVYVYRRDACGNTVFFNTYGDGFSQGGKCVKQTADGGFIVAGITQPSGLQDIILMKLDAAGGLQWIKSFGHAADWGLSVQQTTDKGYIVTGLTQSPSPSSQDVFLLKTDSAGTTQWSEVFVAPGEEVAHTVEQTTDGGYFLTGYSRGSVHGDDDVFAIKTDSIGIVLWSNVYGGTNNDGNTRYDGLSLFTTRGQQTPDKGYVIASATRSFGVNGNSDIWLLKLDSTGTLQWNKTYGGNNDEESRGVDLTADGGFAIIGWTTSFGFGDQDVYLLKTDSAGSLQWSKTYGGTGREKGEAIKQSPIDHGYYIDGYSASFNSNFALFSMDAYAIKTDSVGFTGCNEKNPVTIEGSGSPSTTPFAFTLNTLPGRPSPGFIKNSYNPGEYALCETHPPPDVAQFSAPPVCLGDSTVFTDASTAGFGVVTQWIWDFGDGSPLNSMHNPVHVYATPGTYNVALVIHTTYSCYPDSITLPVIVHPNPVAIFSDSAKGCAPVCKTFNDLSTVSSGTVTAQWTFPGGAPSFSTIQNPTICYNTPGTFDVSMVSTTNFGCSDSLFMPHYIYAFPVPVAAFTNTNVCLHISSDFTDSSTILSGNSITWDWDFGDGTSHSNQQNPSHLYSTAGTDTVVLIVTTVHGCADTVDHPALIYSNPVAAFSDSAKGCTPVCAIFQNLSTTLSGTIVNSDWSFPGGTPSNSSTANLSPTLTICYETPGTYDVSMITTTNFGCKDTLSITQYVRVFEWPKADFSVAPDQASILDPTFNFSGLWSSDVVKWYWDFGDGSSIDSSNTHPVHNYLSTATNNDFYNYKIGIKVKTVHGCWDTISRTIELIPEFTFYIANTFTPNGDYVNDLFYGKGIGIKKYEIMIFDRWGNLIWNCDYDGKNTDWDNWGQEGMSSACKWDGKANHGEDIAQIDVYVWKVQLTDIFNKKHNYMGVVNLVK